MRAWMSSKFGQMRPLVSMEPDRVLVDEVMDGHANRTTNKMFVPHQLLRTRLGL